MSKFAEYEEASHNYDNGRQAAGVDVIAGLVRTHSKKDLKDIHILDAGCGTGNYAVGMLKLGVGKMTMVDGSNGMLTKAKEKIHAMKLDGCVDIKQVFLPTIPYGDNSFDVVMVNQVLHHIGKNPDGVNFPSIMETFKEMRRVLKPSGLLVITSMLKEQLSGVWYYCLNEEFLRRYSLKFPSAKIFKKMLQDSNFDILNFVSVLGHDIVPNYTNLEGPLDKFNRDSESYWDVASKEELQETMNFLRGMKENGTLQNFYNKHDKTDEYGYFVIIVAQNKQRRS